MAFSIGGLINNILDRFLPDVVGDVIGAAVDGAMGNVAGALQNGLDAFQDLIEYLGGQKELQMGEEMLEGTHGASFDELDAQADEWLNAARMSDQ